jgi:hypothetical protein
MSAIDARVARAVCRLLAGGGDHLVDDARRTRHELAHLEQWRQLGMFGYSRRFLTGYIRGRLRGYGHAGAGRRIPLEVQARWEAGANTGDSVTRATSPVSSSATEEPSWSPITAPTTEPSPPPGVTAST